MVKLSTEAGEVFNGIEEISLPEMPVHVSARMLPVDAQGSPGSPPDSAVTVTDTWSVAVAPELSMAFAMSE